MPCTRQTPGARQGTHGSTALVDQARSLTLQLGTRWTCVWCASLVLFFPCMEINLHLAGLELTTTGIQHTYIHYIHRFFKGKPNHSSVHSMTAAITNYNVLEQYKKPNTEFRWLILLHNLLAFRPGQARPPHQFMHLIKAWKGWNIVQQNQPSELGIPSLWYGGFLYRSVTL